MNPQSSSEIKHIDINSCKPGTLVYTCNICSSVSTMHIDSVIRERGNCQVCKSNMRFRSVIHHLSKRLFGKPLNISDFPAEAKTILGIGMSDAEKYASRLVTKLDYENTFFHKPPRLDIQHPEPEQIGAYDFIISSDVLEHVVPPVSTAFVNLGKLLKPGGVLLLTVPFKLQGDTIEHYPDLHDFEIYKQNEEFVLTNRTKDGEIQTFTDLVFHGGPGTTLEMRMFSESGLRQELENAGFTDIQIHKSPVFENGIFWKVPRSVPITAIAP